MKSVLLHLFLVGGGWDSSANAVIYQAFVDAATRGEQRSIVSIHVAEPEDGAEEQQEQVARSQQVLLAAGASTDDIHSITLSQGDVLSAKTLAQYQPTAVFVWGGLTPLYQQVLTSDTSWVSYLQEHQVVYGGFSAGAAISAEKAIVGGWNLTIDHKQVAILDADLAEGLDALDIRPGLGLFNASVDVHASQWGTVTRLMHAIEQQHAPNNGWAIDENTALEITTDQHIKVLGAGQAYRVSRTGAGRVNIDIFRQGDVVQ